MEDKRIINKSQARERYKLKDGMLVPGVTTITGLLNKPGLVPWANGLGLDGINVRDYVDELAYIGKLAHYMIECQLLDEKPALGDYTQNQIDQAQTCVDKFNNWLKHKEFKVLGVEQKMVSEELQFGGTCDLYCELNGKKTLIDLKTSKGIFPEHKLQVTAYWKLLEENNQPVQDIHILRIGRNQAEGFEDIVVGMSETRWKIFRHLLAIYKLNRDLKKEEG